MKKRWDTVLSRMPEGPIIGVEVGVWLGDMSQNLLAGRTDLYLWLVDLVIRGKALHLTEFADKRRGTIMGDSVAAADAFDDNSVDFVFLDADHSYAAVRGDIAAWWPKVKVGGYLCGHDYGKKPHREMGVQQAVEELFPDAEIDDDNTWFVKKSDAKEMGACA